MIDLQMRESGYYVCMQHHMAFVQPFPNARLSVLTALRKTEHQIYACVSSLLKNPEAAAHQLPTPLALPETYNKVYCCVNEAQSGCNGRLDNSSAEENAVKMQICLCSTLTMHVWDIDLTYRTHICAFCSSNPKHVRRSLIADSSASPFSGW